MFVEMELELDYNELRLKLRNFLLVLCYDLTCNIMMVVLTHDYHWPLVLL